MTMYVNSPRAARGQALVAGISKFAMQVLHRVGRALLKRPGTGLEHLDDHLLRDIGVSPDDVQRLLRGEGPGDAEVRRLKR